MRRLLPLAGGAWLAAFVAAPLLVVLVLALSTAAEGVPPFDLPWIGGVNLDAFTLVLTDFFYVESLGGALLVAGGAATLCLLLAFPMALGLTRARSSWRGPLLFALLLPFWTGFLPRIGAWIGLLRDEGWVNTVLQNLGLISAPLPLLYSWPALFLGMLHAYLPFAVLPLYASLSRRDPALEEAAADLGATPARVFASITLPLAIPGAAAAFLLVFIPAAGEYVIPELLGPPGTPMVGRVLWQEFFQNRDWPTAAALAVLLLALLLAPIRLFQRLGTGR